MVICDCKNMEEFLMYVVYLTDIEKDKVVLYNTNSETYTGMSLGRFMRWLDLMKNEVVVGVDVNNNTYCVLEVPALCSDLCGNTLKYISVLFDNPDKRIRFDNGVFSIKFTETEIVSFDLGVEDIDSIIGIYYVLNSVTGDPFTGFMVITLEDNILRQYKHINGYLRLDAEVPAYECDMQLETNRVSIVKRR